MTFQTPPTAVIGSIVEDTYTDIFSANDEWFNDLLPAPAAANLVPIATGSTAAAWGLVDTANIADNGIHTSRLADQGVTTAKIAAGAVTLIKWDTAAALKLVPGGTVGAVRQASEIPSGWTRESNLDGRMPVGAGSEFDVTFVEATNYGSSWSHSHSYSATVGVPNSTVTNLQGGDATGASEPDHTVHALSGTTGSTAWVIPSRAYVFMRKS